jgi:iron complex transport system permease protein
MSAVAGPAAPAAGSASTSRAVLRAGTTRALGLLLLAAAVAGAAVASLAVGSVDIAPAAVLRALVAPDGSDAHAIVTELRVPRTVVALAVGLALGASGALMQGVTRNPLADPGILGVNAGASLAVVVAIFALGITDSSAYVWFALAGGMAVAVIVYGLGASGRDGATPIKLALAGAVVAALLGALTSAVLVLDAQTLDRFRFWVVGSVAGRSLDVLAGTLPLLAAGGLIALASGRWLNALALGDDLARALGQRVTLVRAVCALGAVALAAAGVAAAGPIAFVGLVAPHAARTLAGPDYRWVVPFSAALGGLLLLVADVLGRVVARPSEVEVGVLCAVVGAPFFVALVRRRRLTEL